MDDGDYRNLRDALRKMDQLHERGKFLIYNGYCPWMYGVPMKPTEISWVEAWKILRRLSDKSTEEILRGLTREGPPPLQYAEEGDEYHRKTGKNRFITLMDPERAVYEDKPPW